MANVRLKLTSDKRINNVNNYSDVDVTSYNLTKTLYDRKAIRSSISNILTWKPYERILNPNFGNSLWTQIFENIGSHTRSNITNMVGQMLSAEPRIKVESIDVSANASANEITISFIYSIPGLNGEKEEYSITITKE